MFTKTKEEPVKRSYLAILKRIDNLPDYLPKMSTDFADTLRDQKKKKMLHEIMRDKEAVTALVVWIKNNDKDGAFLNRVSYICGSVIEDEKDLDVFIKGLVSDCWISGVKPDVAFDYIKRNPVLVIIRLLEIVNIKG